MYEEKDTSPTGSPSLSGNLKDSIAYSPLNSPSSGNINFFNSSTDSSQLDGKKKDDSTFRRTQGSHKKQRSSNSLLPVVPIPTSEKSTPKAQNKLTESNDEEHPLVGSKTKKAKNPLKKDLSPENSFDSYKDKIRSSFSHGNISKHLFPTKKNIKALTGSIRKQPKATEPDASKNTNVPLVTFLTVPDEETSDNRRNTYDDSYLKSNKQQLEINTRKSSKSMSYSYSPKNNQNFLSISVDETQKYENSNYMMALEDDSTTVERKMDAEEGSPEDNYKMALEVDSKQKDEEKLTQFTAHSSNYDDTMEEIGVFEEIDSRYRMAFEEVTFTDPPPLVDSKNEIPHLDSKNENENAEEEDSSNEKNEEEGGLPTLKVADEMLPENPSDSFSPRIAKSARKSRRTVPFVPKDDDDISGKRSQSEGDIHLPFHNPNINLSENASQTPERKKIEKIQPFPPVKPNNFRRLSTWDSNFVDFRKKFLRYEPEQVTVLADQFMLFLQTAGTYARMIIAEQHINNSKKHITPINPGGVAGGSKFLIHGIFFKYPTDKELGDGRWLYGGEENNDLFAAKASAHDLLGMSHFIITQDSLAPWLTTPMVHVPLFALIDFQGFRLTSMTELPITEDSLEYGSSDGGRVFKWNADIHSTLLKIAKPLNLQPHFVLQNVESAFCGDLEIHQVRDKNSEEYIYYGLDMARLFPPEYPRIRNSVGYIFFRMLRPELVKQSKHPLSSDAASYWQSYDPRRKEMNQHLKEATDLLLKQVQLFAEYLMQPGKVDKFYTRFEETISHSQPNNVAFSDSIIKELHSRGINIRYLASIFLKIQNNPNPAEAEKLDVLFRTILLSRVIKNIWRKNIRSLSLQASEIGKSRVGVYQICLEQTVEILNSTLELKTNMKNFLEQVLQTMNNMFGVGILNNEEQELLQRLITSGIPTCKTGWVVIRFCQMCGIVLSPEAEYLCRGKKDFSISRIDILDFVPVIKTLPVLDYCIGLHYKRMAETTYVPAKQIKLWKMAEEKFGNLIGYPLPGIVEYCAISQFQIMKCDANHICDMDFIINTFERALQEHRLDRESANIFEASLNFTDFSDHLSKSAYQGDLLNIKNCLLNSDGYQKSKLKLAKSTGAEFSSRRPKFLPLDSQRGLSWDKKLNGHNRRGQNPLYCAAVKGHLDVVRFLLNIEGVDIDRTTKSGSTALHAASYHGHGNILSLLLSAGANTKITNDMGLTAKQEAEKKSNQDILKIWELWKYGKTELLAKHNYPIFNPLEKFTLPAGNKESFTYSKDYVRKYINYLLAILWKELFSTTGKEKVKSLLEEECKKTYSENHVKQAVQDHINQLKKFSAAEIIYAKFLNYSQQLKVLGFTKSNSSHQYYLSRSMLSQNLFRSIMVHKGRFYQNSTSPRKQENPNLIMLKELGKFSPDLLKQIICESEAWILDDEEKQWLFHVYFSIPATIEFCKQNNLNYQHFLPPNPLVRALFLEKSCKSFTSLVMQLDDPDIKQLLSEPDKNQDYPIHKAAILGNLDVTKILIQCKVDLDCQNKNGDSALHIAAKYGHILVVTELIHHGASTTLRNKYDLTAVDYSSTKEIAQILESKQ